MANSKQSVVDTVVASKRLGSAGPMVNALGLGCMGMSGMYGAADDQESLATIHEAVERGITLLDTGDFYGMGHNEMLVGRALQDLDRDPVQVSVKFGALRGPGAEWGGYDARPAAVRNFLAYSLNRLGTDYVDIYRPARLDPSVPIEETVGAIAEQVEKGYVRYIGLSEVGSETIRRAASVHPICDLQIEYSVMSRGIEDDPLFTCRELGIGITAYGVLSRGLITESSPSEFEPTDFRAHAPRFQGENLTRNQRLVEALGEIARRHRISVAQLAIAWVSSRGADIVPLVGMRRRSRLPEALAAISVTLDESDLQAIEDAVPPGAVAGERYAAAQMDHLDSEC